jgi:hypothetical protein
LIAAFCANRFGIGREMGPQDEDYIPDKLIERLERQVSGDVILE